MGGRLGNGSVAALEGEGSEKVCFFLPWRLLTRGCVFSFRAALHATIFFAVKPKMSNENHFIFQKDDPNFPNVRVSLDKDYDLGILVGGLASERD